MSTQGYQAPRCECGHAEGDHKSNGAFLSLRLGVCLVRGCACREFTKADTEDKAA